MAAKFSIFTFSLRQFQTFDKHYNKLERIIHGFANDTMQSGPVLISDT